MKISYAITACDEYAELEELLYFLINEIREEDEIVVVVDEGNVHDRIFELFYQIAENKSDVNLAWYAHPLNKDFAQQKNFLNSKCNKDFIFQIDADEIPHKFLINSLPEILEGNPDCEAYWVPRINTVKGLTENHIKKWGWNVNDKGWVNFPDPQMRIYKNNVDVKWTKPVHEQLVGYNQFSQLPPHEEYCLYHHKKIKRQEKQNEFYDTI
jgi:hypothetical protein